VNLVPDLGRPSHDVVGDDSLDQDRLDPVQHEKVDVHLGEGLLFAAPPGDAVQSDVGRLVVSPLGGGVDGRVGDLARGDAESGNNLALGLNALDGRRVDGNVSGAIALECHLGSLLVARSS
jgi:hypothetical protein